MNLNKEKKTSVSIPKSHTDVIYNEREYMKIQYTDSLKCNSCLLQTQQTVINASRFQATRFRIVRKHENVFTVYCPPDPEF